MKWTKITVEADPSAEEIVSNILMEAGAHGVEISGNEKALSREVPVTWDLQDPFDDTAPYALSAYFPEAEAPAAAEIVKHRLNSLAGDAAAGSMPTSLQVREETVNDADWESAWKEFFKPVRTADYMVVKPTWVDFDAEPGQIVIEIDPGMAFGTGNHETTRLCLAMLEKFVHEGETVVDVGCGSGVLALAAAKIGAGKVYALDADPMAVEVTRENAAVNGVENTVDAMRSDLLSDLPQGVTADMVVCNIIADVIIRLVPQLPDVLRENGMFLCSGIIRERVPDVIDALNEANMRVISAASAGEWAALACKFKK